MVPTKGHGCQSKARMRVWVGGWVGRKGYGRFEAVGRGHDRSRLDQTNFFDYADHTFICLIFLRSYCCGKIVIRLMALTKWMEARVNERAGQNLRMRFKKARPFKFYSSRRRYPTPGSVNRYWGRVGSASSFRRRLRMNMRR